jgi:hypothetical protein
MFLILGALIAMNADPAPSAGSALPTVRATITLHLHASAERALPMFDPVNESLWAPGWKPTLLGEARVAPGLVFTTEDEPSRATWLLDRYDPVLHSIRYVVFRPTTLTTVDINVIPQDAGSSVATVTYTRTALDSSAVEPVTHFAQHFPMEGPHWEGAINAALDADKTRS